MNQSFWIGVYPGLNKKMLEYVVCIFGEFIQKVIVKKDCPMRNINLLSVVVPCHNEQEVLGTTHKRLTAVLEGLRQEKLCEEYECVYVDNGSTDSTLKVLQEIFERDSHVRVISLRRNFGYQGSISAGIFYAEGDAVVTIDADLQDPPEKIGEMIRSFQEGYDLVLGVRKDRSSDSFLKRFFSESYYKFLKMLGVEVVYNHGDFRLMARALVNEFNNLPERDRFIRAMILKLDSHYAVVEYERAAREKGKSKFTPCALLSLSLDGIISFSYAPLRLASLMGIVMCLGSFAMIVWVISIKLFSQLAVPGWASTVLPLLLIGGFQLLFLGLIGEYIGRLYLEVKQRPIFSVRNEYTHNNN